MPTIAAGLDRLQQGCRARRAGDLQHGGGEQEGELRGGQGC